jgi:hypothetical protein
VPLEREAAVSVLLEGGASVEETETTVLKDPVEVKELHHRLMDK